VHLSIILVVDVLMFRAHSARNINTSTTKIILRCTVSKT